MNSILVLWKYLPLVFHFIECADLKLVNVKLAKSVRNESYFLWHGFLNSFDSSIFVAELHKFTFLNKNNKHTNF